MTTVDRWREDRGHNVVACTVAVLFGMMVGDAALAAPFVSLNYTVTSNAGDSWTGVFVIPDMNAQVSTNLPDVSVTSITAVSGATALSFSPNYYGSSSSGYVTWAFGGDTFDYFEFYSPAFYAAIDGGASWNDIVSIGTFALSTVPGEDSKFLQELAPSPNSLTGNGGTLSFVIAPSAVPEIDPAGMGSVAALVTGALGLLERRRKRA